MRNRIWTAKVVDAVKQGSTPRSDHLAIAALLDRADVPPDLTDDVSAIYTGTAVGDIDLVRFLDAYGPHFDRATANPDPGSLLVAAGYHAKATAGALAAGCRIVFVAAQPNWIVDEMAGEVTRTHPLDLNHDAVHDVLDEVYGADLREKLILAYDVDVDVVVLACRKPTRTEAIARLRELAPPQGAEESVPEERKAASDVWPDAEPLAKPAARVVRRLSEMSGFGEAGTWGMLLARDLSAYAAGELAWDDVDKGMLVSGPPGCGKTTFARALAAECGVRLITSGYSDWEAATGARDYVIKGMEKRFAEWRKAAKEGPVIVFLDEVDSLGARGANGQNDSYWSAVINTLLAFADGAEPRDGVVLLAATNHVDRVDPALRRPGRFDRHVEIPAPTVADVAVMVAGFMHGGGEVTDADRVAAKALRGRSPAQVELTCREARRVGRTLGRVADGHDVADVVAWGRPKRLADVDRRVTVHEAAHAIVAHVLGTGIVLALDGDGNVNLGTAGGVMTARPACPTRTEALHYVAHVLAGRRGEIVVLGDHGAGCEVDVSVATSFAHRVEYRWAMGETLAAIDGDSPLDPGRIGRVESVLQEADALAEAVLVPRRWHVDKVARLLGEVRYMEGPEFREAYRLIGVEAFMGPAAEEWAYQEFVEAA